MKATKWGHWAVKLHAAPALVSIDFFEDNGHGNFGIEAVCASLAELNDFFHYYVTENDVHQRKQWKILSSVVPRFKTNNTNNMNMDVETTSERIKCNKKVSDIATFLQEWTRERKSYNTFKSNCQTFCIALYEYLVKEHYPEKIKQLCQYLQSPFDQSQFSNHLKTSKKNNDNDNDNDLHVSQHVKKNTKSNDEFDKNVNKNIHRHNKNNDNDYHGYSKHQHAQSMPRIGILVIWIVSKPIEGMKATKWGHCVVKLHAAPALVSIDFFEKKRKDEENNDGPPFKKSRRGHGIKRQWSTNVKLQCTINTLRKTIEDLSKLIKNGNIQEVADSSRYNVVEQIKLLRCDPVSFAPLVKPVVLLNYASSCCGHIVNEDTAKQILLSETKLCPTCRKSFYNYQPLHEYAQLLQLLRLYLLMDYTYIYMRLYV